MKVTKVQKEKKGYRVTTEDKKEYSIPYIKGTYLYKETKAFIDGGGVIEDEFSLIDLKEKKLEDISIKYQEESTKPISYKDVLYKGGDASASAIAGAVELAQRLGESNVKIIAIDDSENEMSFNDALELSALIARAWRGAFFRYKELKRIINSATTVEELEQITW